MLEEDSRFRTLMILTKKNHRQSKNIIIIILFTNTFVWWTVGI